ncbi:hypothetical protein [Helicobacter pylori]|nr:hypothetical protein [Helicobacter pylori]
MNNLFIKGLSLSLLLFGVFLKALESPNTTLNPSNIEFVVETGL